MNFVGGILIAPMKGIITIPTARNIYNVQVSATVNRFNCGGSAIGTEVLEIGEGWFTIAVSSDTVGTIEYSYSSQG